MRPTNHTENKDGMLTLHGIGMDELAKDYGTPLYVYDESQLRDTAEAMSRRFKENVFHTKVIFASKAASFIALIKIYKELGLGLDVVSEGELHTARLAGFPMKDVVFHGNNKLNRELDMAIEAGVGTIILDNGQEARRLSDLATEKGKVVDVLLRVNPGIDAHTHAYIQTATSDSKFGVALDEALPVLLSIQDLPGLRLRGVHCHIGSQIFASDSFLKSALVMIEALAAWRDAGLVLDVLNLGGGFGVYYTEGDEPFDIPAFLETLSDYVARETYDRGLTLSELWVEPGRSLVNSAGFTLYQVGDVKHLQDDVHYVFIDGGMGDNLRPALYEAKYEACIANRLNEAPQDAYRIAGKYCESGDVLIRGAQLPTPQTGDLLVISGTGAYCFSMFSSYNRLPQPAVVLVNEEGARLAVRRETLDDIVHLDVMD